MSFDSITFFNNYYWCLYVIVSIYFVFVIVSLFYRVQHMDFMKKKKDFENHKNDYQKKTI